MDYSVLVFKDLIYALSYGRVSACHGLCYTCCGSLAGMRNSLSLLRKIDPMTH